MPSLRIVRDKPVKPGEQIARDANDSLSSFPGQKDIRRIATPEQQKTRKPTVRKTEVDNGNKKD